MQDKDKEKELNIEEPRTTLKIGDVVIETKSSMESCKKAVSSLLKDRVIRNYLGYYKHKKIIPTYID